MWPSIIIVSIVTVIIALWALRLRSRDTLTTPPDMEFESMVAQLAQSRIPLLKQFDETEVAAMFWVASGFIDGSPPDPLTRPLDLSKIDPIIEHIRPMLSRFGKVNPNLKPEQRGDLLLLAKQNAMLTLRVQFDRGYSGKAVGIGDNTNPFVMGYIYGFATGAGLVIAKDEAIGLACAASLFRICYGHAAVGREFAAIEAAPKHSDAARGKYLGVTEAIDWFGNNTPPKSLIEWLQSQEERRAP